MLIKFLPNPLDNPPWSGVDKILKVEIKSELENNRLISPQEVIRNTSCSRIDHVRRIAYLIRYPDYKPIILKRNRNIGWPIKDGSHRLAAAIYRNDLEIDTYLI